MTFLHLYHHSLTPLETWICVKFIPGGHGTLGNLINNAVHVIMYMYYMVSAMGPEYQKYLWWKKHLTTVQLVGVLICQKFFISSTSLLFVCVCVKCFIFSITLIIFLQKIMERSFSCFTVSLRFLSPSSVSKQCNTVIHYKCN